MGSHPRFCTLCGRHESEVGRLSSRGRCEGCADDAMLSNTREIRDRVGPAYVRWLNGLQRWVTSELRR